MRRSFARGGRHVSPPSSSPGDRAAGPSRTRLGQARRRRGEVWAGEGPPRLGLPHPREPGGLSTCRARTSAGGPQQPPASPSSPVRASARASPPTNPAIRPGYKRSPAGQAAETSPHPGTHRRSAQRRQRPAATPSRGAGRELQPPGAPRCLRPLPSSCRHLPAPPLSAPGRGPAPLHLADPFPRRDRAPPLSLAHTSRVPLFPAPALPRFSPRIGQRIDPSSRGSLSGQETQWPAPRAWHVALFSPGGWCCVNAVVGEAPSTLTPHRCPRGTRVQERGGIPSRGGGREAWKRRVLPLRNAAASAGRRVRAAERVASACPCSLRLPPWGRSEGAQSSLTP